MEEEPQEVPPVDLDMLVEIPDPAPVSNDPATPAWTGFFVVLAVLLVLALAWAWRRWRKNRYRRHGLAHLAEMEAEGDLSAVPVLVKRVALEAWPREDVASLTGEMWLTFLDGSMGGGESFSKGAGRRLLDLAYGDADASAPDQELVALVRTWIRSHRT